MFLIGVSLTEVELVGFTEFDGQQGGHDFSETGNFPLILRPEPYHFFASLVIEAPALGGDVCMSGIVLSDEIFMV